MRFGRVNFTHDYGLAAQGVVFDPTGISEAALLSMAMTAAGGAMGGASTLAGGSFAKTAGYMQKQAADYQATQIEQNATQAIASGQRQMMDTQLKTNMAVSTSRANAAASGGAADTGSAVENEGQIAQRGGYQALMDMFNGQSTATGLENQAKGVRYSGELAKMEGEAKQKASYLAAAGQIASTVGNMASTYGKFKYPTSRGNFGA